MNQLLPGSPVADEVPLAGVIQVGDEDQQADPGGRQQNRGGNVQNSLHWPVSVPGNLSGSSEMLEPTLPLRAKVLLNR
jgi:hypothetical protein